jgi:3-hydroxybutyryl-CoA dehydrogenase
MHTSLIVVNAVLTPLSVMRGDFVRINGWPGFLSRNIMEAACSNVALMKNAEMLFSRLGRTTEWVPDEPGFVTPRIVAAIINEAFLALEEKVSREEEIDTAMKLGTNYPYGPFEWGQKIGYGKVYSLLELLGNEHSRYKPSILMKGKILV